MKKNERVILHYDLKMVASSRTFESPSVLSIRRAFRLLELIPEELRATKRARGSQTFYLSDIEVTDTYAKILFNKSDKNIPDPVFSVPSKKTRRTAAKQVEEGQDFACHILVKIPPPGQLVGLMLVEQAPGLSTPFVVMMLNRLLRLASRYSPRDFVQVHPDGSLGPDGKPRTYNVRHRFEAMGQLAETFEADLNRGQLKGIELTTNKLQAGFDQSGYLKEEKEVLFLKPSLSVQRPRDLARHVSAMLKGQSDYSSARIKFEPPDGGRAQNVLIDATTGVAEKYVKRSVIAGFTRSLASSYDKMHGEIIEKMMHIARHA
jgi:hypothetical protein